MTHARPCSAASRAGVQMQGFHPTVCGLPSAREWLIRGTAQVCAWTTRKTQDHLAQPGGPQSQDPYGFPNRLHAYSLRIVA